MKFDQSLYIKATELRESSPDLVWNPKLLQQSRPRSEIATWNATETWLSLTRSYIRTSGVIDLPDYRWLGEDWIYQQLNWFYYPLLRNDSSPPTFIRAEQNGDWDLHLHCTANTIPVLHAGGHRVYTKSVRLYLERWSNFHRMQFSTTQRDIETFKEVKASAR